MTYPHLSLQGVEAPSPKPLSKRSARVSCKLETLGPDRDHLHSYTLEVPRNAVW